MAWSPVTETLESLNPFKTQPREAETGRERRATRHDWQTFEIVDLLEAPLFDLIDEARAVHRRYHADGQVQLASLLSIKTGACPEDCKYCPQSAHYAKKTGLERESLLDVEDVLSKARIAKEAGATRFCMGAAWRQVKDGPEFEKVLDMVRGVRDLEMEACVTLGMVTKDQAGRLAEAGLTAYNHNLDTSPEFYSEIITTRTYEDRLETIANVRSAGVQVCCGGIIGMGESIEDRARLLQELATFDPHPESVPISAGTGRRDPARIPSQGRTARTRAHGGGRPYSDANILRPAVRRAFGADARGADPLLPRRRQLDFYGDKLLTTENNDAADDRALIEEAGLRIKPACAS